MKAIIKFRTSYCYSFVDGTRVVVKRSFIMKTIYKDYYSSSSPSEFYQAKQHIADIWDELRELEKAEWRNEFNERKRKEFSVDNPQQFMRTLSPEQAYLEQEQKDKINRALSKLTDRQLLIVERTVIDGQRQNAVARELGITNGALRRQLLAALNKLRKYL